MICTFFGHRDTPPEIKNLLQQVISELIEQQGVNWFYVGNQGNFDAMARNLLTEFEQTHGIRYEIVLAYLPRQKDSHAFFAILAICGFIENIPE